MRRVILGALIISVATCLSAQEQARVSTRFGSLTVGNNKELLFRGRSVVPSIVGNNGLDLGTPFHLKAEDVVLVTDNGGTACLSIPLLFRDLKSVGREGHHCVR